MSPGWSTASRPSCTTNLDPVSCTSAKTHGCIASRANEGVRSNFSAEVRPNETMRSPPRGLTVPCALTPRRCSGQVISTPTILDAKTSCTHSARSPGATSFELTVKVIARPYSARKVAPVARKLYNQQHTNAWSNSIEPTGPGVCVACGERLKDPSTGNPLAWAILHQVPISLLVVHDRPP